MCVAIFSPSRISLPDELPLKIMLSLALGFFVLTAARGVGDQNCFVMLMREDDAAKIYSYFQLPWIQSSLTLKFFTAGLALVVTVVISQMANLLVWLIDSHERGKNSYSEGRVSKNVAPKPSDRYNVIPLSGRSSVAEL